jgi:hypothetical protein
LALVQNKDEHNTIEQARGLGDDDGGFVWVIFHLGTVTGTCY